MTHIGLSLQSANGEPYDLHLDGTGNLAVVSDAEAVGQHVRQRLKTYSGEWFLDTRAGVTWLDDVLGQSYDPSLAEALIKAEILNTDGVKEIASFSATFNKERRELTAFSISVLTDYDEEITL